MAALSFSPSSFSIEIETLALQRQIYKTKKMSEEESEIRVEKDEQGTSEKIKSKRTHPVWIILIFWLKRSSGLVSCVNVQKLRMKEYFHMLAWNQLGSNC
jgi:hypothetical protein